MEMDTQHCFTGSFYTGSLRGLSKVDRLYDTRRRGAVDG